jgi:hypothetical protein
MGMPLRTIFLSRSSRGAFHGVGLGQPILVPETIDGYEDVSEVVLQLKPLQNAFHVTHLRSASPDPEPKMLALGYFLGVMVGDMSKYPIQRKNYKTMRVGIQLSKRYQSNLRFGDYVTHCAALLGIRMKRIGDYMRPKEWPYDAYRWVSQYSELLMWFFETCLGMGLNERTTNDPVHAEWIKTAPFNFQRSFLQGISDSDGYVDINKHEIGIVVDPNEFLIGDILGALRVHFRPAIVKGQATLMMSVKEAHALPIFNPIVRTHKFELTERLSNATRFQGPWPAWLRREVDELVHLEKQPSEIIITILNNHNVAIRSQHLKGPIRSRVENHLGAEGGI